MSGGRDSKRCGGPDNQQSGRVLARQPAEALRPFIRLSPSESGADRARQRPHGTYAAHGWGRQRSEASPAALLALGYGVPIKAARQAISWGIGKRCAELADRSPEPSKAFIAALNALQPRPKPVRPPPSIAVTFPPLADLIARTGAE